MSKTVVARRSKRLMGMKTKEKKGDGETRFEEEDAVENALDLKRTGEESTKKRKRTKMEFQKIYTVSFHL